MASLSRELARILDKFPSYVFEVKVDFPKHKDIGKTKYLRDVSLVIVKVIFVFSCRTLMVYLFVPLRVKEFMLSDLADSFLYGITNNSWVYYCSLLLKKPYTFYREVKAGRY